MTIRAVGQDNDTRLSTIVKSTAAGTVGGYAVKYLWPVTKQEDDINRRAMINYCRKITNKAKVDEFNTLGKAKSKAQDAFIKMIDDEKQGLVKNEKGEKVSPFTNDYYKKVVKELGGDDSFAGKEFMNIIGNVNETSRRMAKRFMISHKITLKRIRPVVPFLVAGAGVGFFTGFAHNVMKTDYYA